MAKCQFCKRMFSNAQGVRAHLKHCHLYKGRGQGPKTLPSQPRGHVNEEEHLNQLLRGASHSQVARLYSSQSSSYPKEREITQSIQPQDSSPPHSLPPARKEDNFRRDQLRKKEEERKKQFVQQQLEQRKRQLIQQIKTNVVDCYLQWEDVSVEAKVRAKISIDRKLSTLPVLDLPFYEVQQIGEALRDRVYASFRKKPVVQHVQPPTQEMIMSMTKVLSGCFYCPQCDCDFELDRTPESEARCPTCRVALEEDQDVEEDGQEGD